MDFAFIYANRHGGKESVNMKHKFLAKRHWNSGPTILEEFSSKSKKYSDIINLTLGDPDFTTSDIIMKPAFEDAEKGHTHYTNFFGDEELREEICNYYKEEFDLDVKQEEVIVCSGASHALCSAFESILDDGDEVIIHSPYYAPYPEMIRLSRGVPVALETFEEEGFQINFERLESIITNRTRAIMLNTPNNPTGARFSEETIAKIVEIVKKHDMLLIADDIYGLYVFDTDKKQVPIMALDGMRERTITVCSASKDYAMTGWRVGYAVAPDYIIKTMQTVSENNIFTANSVSQRAYLYALRNRKAIQEEMYEIFRERVFKVYDRVCRIKNMKTLKPQGTFYMFINIKETGLSSMEVANKILEEAHVLVLPAHTFGPSGEGYIRIACTVDVDKIDEAFDRIEKMDIFS